jgi:hypothetical protein
MSNEPIKAGDHCDVIDGARGKESPNVGLRVVVKAYRGEHTVFGRIWRCEAEFAELHQPGIDCPPGQADFAQSWLKKVEPPKPTTKVTETTGDEVKA